MSRGTVIRARFDRYEFDTESGELWRDGLPVRLAPQPAKVLCLLVERVGKLVSREDMQKALWQGETYVDFDQGLNYCIRQIRIALEDSADQPSFVATVPRRGYRFVAEVSEVVEETPVAVEPQPAPIEVVPESVEAPEVPKSPEPGFASLPPDMAAAGRSRRMIWVAAAVVLVAGFLAAGSLWFVRGRKGATTNAAGGAEGFRVPIRTSVAVLGFANLNGNEQDAWLSTGLAEMFSTELSEGGRLRLVSGEEIARSLPASRAQPHTLSRETRERMRRELSADLFVLGSYTVLTQDGTARLRVDVQLQDAKDGRVVAAFSQTGREADLFELVERCGATLRQDLGAGVMTRLEEAAFDGSFPANPNARRLYAEGLNRLRRYDPLSARESLEQAIAIEPKFGPARSALAAAWSSMGYDAKAAEEAKRASELTEGMTREGQLSVEARYYEMSRDYKKAEEELGTLSSFFADDLEYGIRLATVQMRNDRFDGALATLAKLRRLPDPLGTNPRLDMLESQIRSNMGDFKQAQTFADEAIRKGRATGSDLLIAQSLIFKAFALERLGLPDQSLVASDEAKRINTETNYPKGVGLALLVNGDVLNDKGDFRGARERFENALSFFREIGDRKDIGAALERIGNTYHDQGKFAESENDYRRALETYKEIDWKYGAASALGNLANTLDAQGDPRGSLKMHEEALQGFRATGQKRGTASEIDNIAEVQMEIGDLAGAEQSHRTSLALHREIGYRHGEMYALAGLGDIFLQQNRLADARKQYDEARKLAEATKEENDVARMDLNLAAVTFYEKHYPEAQTLVRRSADRFQADKDSEDCASAYALLTRILIRERKKDDATAAGKQAQTCAEQITSLPPQFEVSMALARLDAAKGDTEAARRRVQAVLERSRRGGYERVTLEGRGVLFGLERQGSEKSRRVALAGEARHKGFGLLAAEFSAPEDQPGMRFENTSLSF